MALHTIGIISFSYSFKWLIDHPNHASTSSGWHFQYLTILGIARLTSCGINLTDQGLAGSLITFLIGFLGDLTLSQTAYRVNYHLLQMTSAVSIVINLHSETYIFSKLELVVSLLYWPIAFYDKSLLMPVTDLDRTPIWADCSFHLAPAIFLSIDFLFFSPPSETALAMSVGQFTSLGLAYYFWVEWCYQRNGFYAYPMLHHLSPTGKFWLFLGATALALFGSIVLSRAYRAMRPRLVQ